MKHAVLAFFVVAILVLALTFPAGAPVAMAAHTSTAAALPAPPPHAAANGVREAHPEIRAAIASLRRARQHLQNAAHDFGGHRVDAIKAIDGAIEQLQACLQYDK